MRLLVRLLPVVPVLLFGCSQNGVSPVGSGGGEDLGAVEAMDMTTIVDMTLPQRAPDDHPPVPAMEDHGGPRLAAMEIWTIVWKGDEALGDRVNTFDDWMMSSPYWTSSLSEYGVGPGKAMGVIVLPDAVSSTLDDSALSPLIKGHIADKLLPAPNANTVFSFILPIKTTSTMYGQTGCQEYGGYHNETRVQIGSKQYVPYLINLQCGGFGGVTEFDSLTEVVSHEAAEVATDPHPNTNTAYNTFGAPLGGEVGDLCAGLSQNYTVSQKEAGDAGTVDSTYYVTRLWSNVAAAANNADPCVPVPVPLRPYFNVAVDPVDITIMSGSKGSTFEAKLEPFAYGDVGTIKWKVQTQPGPGITVSPTTGSANAGDTIRLTVTTTSAAQSGTYPLAMFTSSAKGGNNQWVSSINIQ